jgi:branched-chain amino acid transport system permease protein
MVLLMFFLLLAPLAIRANDYFLRIAINILLYTVLASSLNIINGYSGLLNIGHAGFYLIGAYTAAILATRAGLSFWILLPVSGIMASLFSLLLSFPTMRLKGIYFAMTTLGFSEIARLTVLNWTSLTRGPMGIPGIPFPKIFGLEISGNFGFYYLILGIAVVTIFVCYRVLYSRIGRAWIAIREDEMAARAMGIPTFKYKLLNIAFATFWAGVAGCYFAFLSSYVSADSFLLDEGFVILAMVLIGGSGSLVGPVVGAVFLVIIPEVFRFLAEYRLVVYGLAILATMHFRPQGIAGGGAFSKLLKGNDSLDDDPGPEKPAEVV